MKKLIDKIRLSATDLANHLSCGHLTGLNLGATLGEIPPPEFRAPDLVVLQQRGLEHEDAYLGSLVSQGLGVADLRHALDDETAVNETITAMSSGVEVIVQGALRHAEWFGRPDVLRRVEKASDFGSWSYEPYDCKLARETKAATVLQLTHYAALVGVTQGRDPETFYVVPPSDKLIAEPFRFMDFAAYYRAVRSRLIQAIDERPLTYPEPVSHCDICRWWSACNRRRRLDDHLSFTAGISRLQRKQLVEWENPTMTDLAKLPIPLSRRPRHGSKEGYERVREQARVQVTSRYLGSPIFEVFPTLTGRGLCRLPEPSEGDLFFDLESDPFVGKTGREYLFGFIAADANGTYAYERRWALSGAEEKAAFEWFVDVAMERWIAFPGMHIYHYGHKEPSTLKSLMGRHGTSEDAIDRMLRAGIMVDLHSVVKQSLRASVEEYSLKALEDFHAYERAVALENARTAMRQIEHCLELEREGQIDENTCTTVEAYNSDDCRSTRSLRDWLESIRSEAIRNGTVIERPTVQDGAPSEALGERQERVNRLVKDLMAAVPADPASRTTEESAKRLLANLLNWHRREDKAACWEKYRLRDMSDEDLQDERAAVAGLQYVRTTPPKGKDRMPTDEYTFPPQEISLREGDDLYQAGRKMGTVEFIEPVRGVIGIKKTAQTLTIHPSAVYSYKVVDSDVLAESLLGLGEWVRDHGFGGGRVFQSACDLLLRRPPRTSFGEGPLVSAGESVVDAAKRLATKLNSSVLAIQGPPGAGKTYTGARMIVELIRQGKRVGVTAGSHKVARKLLDEIQKAAVEAGLARVRCLQKVTDGSEDSLPDWLEETKKNADARSSIERNAHDVVAGTPWLWARVEMQGLADVLFVDEAGQMSLANAIAIAPAATSMVLLGDPQQLDQPLKGSHPEGAEVSAMEHILEGEKTIASERGLFLDKTWRLHPDICRFTSEMFYNDLLESREGLENQSIEGHPWLGSSGLRFLPMTHNGNQNSSVEEVDYIAELVQGLLTRNVYWVNDKRQRSPLRPQDILIVAPYNAQVALLANRLNSIAVGTVDKFQGQEAPVVIYSLTTSSPEDAPRGMEFLYSLNRLNVATSRAKALAIVVGSPKLLEPECKSPRQMQLANALCRFVELADSEQLAMFAT